MLCIDNRMKQGRSTMESPKRPIGRLHVLTDTKIQARYSHVDIARLAIEAGADVIQLRDKELSTKELLRVGEAIKILCQESNVTFIVNDRVDVALALEADGVHLGQDDMPIAMARKLLRDKIIGGSAGDLLELQNCLSQGADYIGFGPIFPTTTKPDAGPSIGIHALLEAVKHSRVPIIAIGGIAIHNVGEVMATGAYGIAVISCVAKSEDPRAVVRALREKIRAFGS